MYIQINKLLGKYEKSVCLISNFWQIGYIFNGIKLTQLSSNEDLFLELFNA